jgi:hypothetical protein
VTSRGVAMVVKSAKASDTTVIQEKNSGFQALLVYQATAHHEGVPDDVDYHGHNRHA